jgi:hypothetical protein
MEPVSLIVAALVGGATAALKDTATQAVTDAYSALKSFIASKFKKKASIESLEETPDSKAKQEAVKEDLVAVDAANDDQVWSLAKALIEEIKKHAPDAVVVGFDVERLEAEFVRIGNVRSTQTGVRGRDWKLKGGVEVGDIDVGSKDRDPP